MMKSESDFVCRICFEGKEEGELFSPCKCSGTIKYVHVGCLEKWRELSANPNSVLKCPNCNYQYNLYRPLLAKFLKSEVVISVTAVAATGVLTIGSGSTVVFLSKSKWNANNVILYGFAVIGMLGITPRLPVIFQDVLQYLNWHKIMDQELLLPTGAALLMVGVITTYTSVYQKVRAAARTMVKNLGERVLEVQVDETAKQNSKS